MSILNLFHAPRKGQANIPWAWLLVALASLAAVMAPAAGERPNIVFFLADDLGQRDVGVYGSTFYETPSVDRLAREGMRFTDSYAACPVCSPTRASILTGKYPQRTGVTDYIGAAQPAQWKRNTRHLPAPYSERLALDEVTLAEALKQRGYKTFHGGKWHLGPEGFWPEDQGFDVNKGGIGKGGPYGGKRYFSPYDNPRLPDGPEGEHLPDRIATEAIKFIETHRRDPFFVYVPFYDVHTPLMAREDLRKKYEAKRQKLRLQAKFGAEPPRRVREVQEDPVYAGMVEAMDLAVGKVLAALDRLGLSTNTIVVFTSDNGGLSTSEGSPTSNLPLRAGKGWLYEGGIRVPLIVRWPKAVKAGVVENTPVTSPDFYPTLLSAVGVSAQTNQPGDGISLLRVLTQTEPAPARPIFWHYPHYGNQGGAPGAAVRLGKWKLIEWFDDDRVELFNLADDMSETNNLADTNPEVVRELRLRLRSWQKEVGALPSTPNPAFRSEARNGRL